MESQLQLVSLLKSIKNFFTFMVDLTALMAS